MANSWFKFKQFTIEQGQSAMKVGTDGVLLGAWANVEDKNRILDIGTGTGLIALMLAQRNSNAQIDAVEIDKLASEQARGNFDNSNWAERLNNYNLSIQDFVLQTQLKYDFIISNPPYFEHSYSAKTIQRQTARETITLNFSELIAAVQKILEKEGSFAVILPYSATDGFINLTKQAGLYLNYRTNIYPTLKSEIKRVLLEFSFVENKYAEDKLVIEPTTRHKYSNEYKELTKDFYLKF